MTATTIIVAVILIAVVLAIVLMLPVVVLIPPLADELDAHRRAEKAADEAVWVSWRDDPRGSSLDYREVFAAASAALEAADKAAEAARRKG